MQAYINSKYFMSYVVDRVSLASLTRNEEVPEYGRQDDDNRKPRYYEGVYSNDRTISTIGDVTPISVRTPISKGVLNLPRYVPKYTISSRLPGNRSTESFGHENVAIPCFRDEPIYTKKQGHRIDPSNREVFESSQSADTKTKSSCCGGSRNYNRKCRRRACIVIVCVIIAAALAGGALGLYFGYFDQFGDPSQMTVDFTFENVQFESFLSNLSSSETQNLTKAICGAFQNTLQTVGGIEARVSYCDAVSYSSGSIEAIFNIDVQHKRRDFINSGSGFLPAVLYRLNEEFQLAPSSGKFNLIFRYLNNNFTIKLKNVIPGHKSLPAQPSTAAEQTTAKITPPQITTSSRFTSNAILQTTATSKQYVTMADVNSTGNATGMMRINDTATKSYGDNSSLTPNVSATITAAGNGTTTFNLTTAVTVLPENRNWSSLDSRTTPSASVTISISASTLNPTTQSTSTAKSSSTIQMTRTSLSPTTT